MLSVQSMIEESGIWVDLVEDSVSIALMACCKHDDFPFFLHLFEKGNGIGSNVEADFKRHAINANG